MGKCSKCSNAQASYYDPDDGPGRYCKQCARDVSNVVSRWQKDKKRKAEARGEGAGAAADEAAQLKQQIADLQREKEEVQQELAMCDLIMSTAESGGGIEAIITAMRSRGGSAGAQARGCFALGTLAKNTTNSAEIVTWGGVEAVLAAMRSHGDSAAVQVQGCKALYNLSEGAPGAQWLFSGGNDTDVIARLRDCDAAEVLRGVRTKFCAHARITMPVDRVLKKLC